MEQHERDEFQGVTFTAEEHEAVRQWVQDRSQQSEVIATPTRLYLPVFGSMTTVDEGDTIWFDTYSTKPNPFQIERA